MAMVDSTQINQVGSGSRQSRAGDRSVSAALSHSTSSDEKVLTSFTQHYGNFIGFPDEATAASVAAASAKSRKHIVRSILKHPLTKPAAFGAGSVALTCLIGLSLTHTAKQGPGFTYNPDATPEPSDADLQADELTATANSPNPSNPLQSPAEFSQPRPAQANADSMSRIYYPRPYNNNNERAKLIEQAINQQMRELEQFSSRLSTPGNGQSDRAASSTSTPAKAPTLAATSQTTASVATPPAPAPSAADTNEATANAMPLVAAQSGQAQVEQLAPAPATAPPASEQPNAPVADVSQLAANATPASLQTATASQSDAQLRQQLEQAQNPQDLFIPASEFLTAVNSNSLNLVPLPEASSNTQSDAAPADQANSSSPAAASNPVSAASVGAKPTPLRSPLAQGSNAAQAAQPMLYGLRYFVEMPQHMIEQNGLAMLPLTGQAARELAGTHSMQLKTDQMKTFQVYRLSPEHYYKLWAYQQAESKDDFSIPAYGFVDYQRQVIIAPMLSSSADPNVG